jgi:hypothetical protein
MRTNTFYIYISESHLTFGIGFSTGVGMMLAVMVAGLCIEKRHNWYNIQSQVAKEESRKKSHTSKHRELKGDKNVNCYVPRSHTHLPQLQRRWRLTDVRFSVR